MTQTSLTLSQYQTATHPLRRLRRLLVDCAAWLVATQRLIRERDQLADLSDSALKDLGLTRADVWAELRKPVWQR